MWLVRMRVLFFRCVLLYDMLLSLLLSIFMHLRQPCFMLFLPTNIVSGRKKGRKTRQGRAEAEEGIGVRHYRKGVVVLVLI